MMEQQQQSRGQSPSQPVEESTVVDQSSVVEGLCQIVGADEITELMEVEDEFECTTEDAMRHLRKRQQAKRGYIDEGTRNIYLDCNKRFLLYLFENRNKVSPVVAEEEIVVTVVEEQPDQPDEESSGDTDDNNIVTTGATYGSILHDSVVRDLLRNNSNFQSINLGRLLQEPGMFKALLNMLLSE